MSEKSGGAVTPQPYIACRISQCKSNGSFPGRLSTPQTASPTRKICQQDSGIIKQTTERVEKKKKKIKPSD
ncbi:MAG: hypothetical protein AAFS12_05930 [Cyanobacteria bacterium J06632_19]